MKWKTLKMIADTGSVTAEVSNTDLGIVKVSFHINGAYITAQFDPDNDGVYAIEISGNSLLCLLGLDEKGHPIVAETEEKAE